MPDESALTRKILDALNAQPDTYALKIHISRFGRAGIPDILGCCAGHAFGIEVKAAKGRATSLQLYQLDRMAKAGARVGIARSVEDALAIARGE